MDWNERRIGNKIPVRCEECAREVQPLLDVRADRCLLQRPPHCLSHTHEPVCEESEENRIRPIRLLRRRDRDIHGVVSRCNACGECCSVFVPSRKAIIREWFRCCSGDSPVRGHCVDEKFRESSGIFQCVAPNAMGSKLQTSRRFKLVKKRCQCQSRGRSWQCSNVVMTRKRIDVPVFGSLLYSSRASRTACNSRYSMNEVTLHFCTNPYTCQRFH